MNGLAVQPHRRGHVARLDAGRFLDFVSRRSPVFKTRPLPKSKKEAIDLMMAQPNLIKRPLTIAGRKIIAGFERDQLRKTLGVRE